MRWGILPILSVGLLVGCTMHPKPQPQQAVRTPPTYYQPRSSGSLVFDPPVTAGQPDLDLSRDDRGTVAFMGFDSGITTSFFLVTDDRQAFYDRGRSGNNDYYDRRAVSVKVGQTYR